jgi:hypothetical protein
VYIAEACFRRLPITVPSSRDLRLRFLEELTAPYERDGVLNQCGISNDLAPSQKVDTRVIAPQPASRTLTEDHLFTKLTNFDTSALRNAFLEKPVEISRVKCFRILQCVNEIGSPDILESIKSALTRRPEDRTAQTVDEPIVEKLFQIHIYLDAHDSRSHIIVARNRYIKYCYFEAYQIAVQVLQGEKRYSLQEQRRLTAHKETLSYKQGLWDQLPATPHSDNIERNYDVLSAADRRKRAPDMVKDGITRKVIALNGGKKELIRRKINRYIREGRVLHHVLQGAICLNPGLFILFPSQEMQKPALDLEVFQPYSKEIDLKSLEKPITMKE